MAVDEMSWGNSIEQRQLGQQVKICLCYERGFHGAHFRPLFIRLKSLIVF